MNKAATALNKVLSIIESSIHIDHLEVSDKLIALFKRQYPKNSITTLQNALQLRRIEIDHLDALCDGIREKFNNRHQH